jgi:dethiobiotin synthetase
MSAIFVTATGTEIGKTFVVASLIRHWRAAGRPVEALKPVVTGFDPADAVGSDPGILLAALGRTPTLLEIERIARFRFTASLAPDMAARHERRTLDFRALVEFCRHKIARHDGTLLIEGVGGVMVPLDERHTVLDWMSELKIPLLLVAGSYLGTVSHTLSALDALRRRGLTIKAIVLNATPGSTVSMPDTVQTLTNFADGIPIVPLPRLSAGADNHPAIAGIATLL